METRFFVPGALVANLDFIERIFGNAGDPHLPALQHEPASALVAGAGHRLPRGLMMMVGSLCYGISVMLFAASPWCSRHLRGPAACASFSVFAPPR